MRAILTLAVAAAVSGQSTPADPQHDAQAQAKLDKILAGRVPGTPIHCLPVVDVLHPIAIDDQTLVFREGPRVWVNNLRGSLQCGQLDRMSDVSFESQANRVCADNTLYFTSGSLQGACALGDFVPCAKP